MFKTKNYSRILTKLKRKLRMKKKKLGDVEKKKTVCKRNLNFKKIYTYKAIGCYPYKYSKVAKIS